MSSSDQEVFITEDIEEETWRFTIPNVGRKRAAQPYTEVSGYSSGDDRMEIQPEESLIGYNSKKSLSKGKLVFKARSISSESSEEENVSDLEVNCDYEDVPLNPKSSKSKRSKRHISKKVLRKKVSSLRRRKNLFQQERTGKERAHYSALMSLIPSDCVKKTKKSVITYARRYISMLTRLCYPERFVHDNVE